MGPRQLPGRSISLWTTSRVPPGLPSRPAASTMGRFSSGSPAPCSSGARFASRSPTLSPTSPAARGPNPHVGAAPRQSGAGHVGPSSVSPDPPIPSGAPTTHPPTTPTVTYRDLFRLYLLGDPPPTPSPKGAAGPILPSTNCRRSETWLSTASMTCGCTPRSAIRVATVRRTSCRRQGATRPFWVANSVLHVGDLIDHPGAAALIAERPAERSSGPVMFEKPARRREPMVRVYQRGG
jgi:hypothetical protein